MKVQIKSLIKILLGCITIILFYVVIGEMVLFGFKLPEIVRKGAEAERLPEIIGERIADGSLYFPDALEPEDRFVFSGLIHYDNSIAVGTGHLLHKGMEFPWFVVLKKLPFSNDWTYDKNTDYIYKTAGIGNSWMGTTDTWFFFSKEITVASDALKVSGVTKANLDRLIPCIIILAGFCGGAVKMYKRKQSKTTTRD